MKVEAVKKIVEELKKEQYIGLYVTIQTKHGHHFDLELSDANIQLSLNEESKILHLTYIDGVCHDWVDTDEISYIGV